MTVHNFHRRGGGRANIASERVVSRLILYRRLLREMSSRGIRCVFSHQIAKRANATPAQLRRDLMGIGSAGTPSRGYEVKELEARIGDYLAASAPQRAALAGVGNLGRALLEVFDRRAGPACASLQHWTRNRPQVAPQRW
jgi:NADH/NAD ratio-sensing transcriptional regulator Rex